MKKRTPTAADAHDLKIVVKLRAVPASKVPFPVEIAGFPDFSRPVPVYPAFLKYVVPVQFETLQKCIRLSAEGRRRYVEQYGPVSLRDLESSDVYDWLNAPWPWQQEGEGK